MPLVVADLIHALRKYNLLMIPSIDELNGQPAKLLLK